MVFILPDRSGIFPCVFYRPYHRKHGLRSAMVQRASVSCHTADKINSRSFLCYLSVFISFLVVYPVIHISTFSGLSQADYRLLEMAKVFHVPLWKQALHIYRLSLYPYLESGLKTALGMGFKSGIAAEVIGIPDGSIGEGLYLSKIYLSSAELFAWTLTIILVSTLFEKIVLFLWKKTAGYGIQIQEEIHGK